MIILAKRIYLERDIVIKAITSLYGEFKNNFIQIYGKSSDSVSSEIYDQLGNMGYPDIILDVYVYISSFDDDNNTTVIIRRAVK